MIAHEHSHTYLLTTAPLLRNKIIVLLIISMFGSMVFDSCRIFQSKKTCPAYMNGAATGTSGSKEKRLELYPKDMRK